MGNKEEIIFYDKNRILMIPKKFFVNNEKIYQGLFLINRFSQGQKEALVNNKWHHSQQI